MHDLEDQLVEDGVDARVKALAAPVSKKEQAHEVLRIAALLADASDGVSDVERDDAREDCDRRAASRRATSIGAIADVRAAMPRSERADVDPALVEHLARVAEERRLGLAARRRALVFEPREARRAARGGAWRAARGSRLRGAR